MSTCLPGILVDIVEIRPPDPILYLAQRLRQLWSPHSSNQPPDGSTSSSGPSSGAVVHHSETVGEKLDTGIGQDSQDSSQVSQDNVKMSSLYIQTDKNGQDGNDSFLYPTNNDTSTVLHVYMDSVFRHIGDLFDLDDIS